MKNSNNRKYDLEERTFKFAKEIRLLVKNCKKTIETLEDFKQLLRSSGSIGANYIEANEALSKKDFAMRVKICRKEAKETVYWLKLLSFGIEQKDKIEELKEEAVQLTKFFGSIVEKTK